ncbi:hypothetical protein GEMRC1_002277 [Eukaryota sp. GEM-RC1]
MLDTYCLITLLVVLVVAQPRPSRPTYSNADVFVILSPVKSDVLLPSFPFNITWTTTGQHNTISISYACGFSDWIVVANAIPNTNFFLWTPSGEELGDSCRIQLSADSKESTSDVFTITNSPLKVLYPAFNDIFSYIDSVNVQWSNVGQKYFDRVDVIFRSEVLENDVMLASNLKDELHFVFSLNETFKYGQGQILVRASQHLELQAKSEKFYYFAKVLTITNPTSYSMWFSYQNYTVAWSNAFDPNLAEIALIDEYGVTINVDIVDRQSNSITVNCPNIPDGRYYVIVSSKEAPSTAGVSTRFDVRQSRISIDTKLSQNYLFPKSSLKLNYLYSGNIDFITVKLNCKSKTIDLAEKFPVSSSFLLTVPENAPVNEDCAIKFFDTYVPKIETETEYFKIFSSPRFVSPFANQIFQPDDKVLLKWESKSDVSACSVDLYVKNTVTGHIGLLSPNQPLTSSYLGYLSCYNNTNGIFNAFLNSSNPHCLVSVSSKQFIVEDQDLLPLWMYPLVIFSFIVILFCCCFRRAPKIGYSIIPDNQVLYYDIAYECFTPR